VLATTNGAPAIVAAAYCASTVLLAGLLNLRAVLDLLRALAYDDLQIVCSGTDGAAALEDAYLAGRIVSELNGARSDAALVAQAVSRAYGSPLEALGESADAAVLRAAGLGDDVGYCAAESTIDLVPRLVGMRAGAAVVADGRPIERHRDPTSEFDGPMRPRAGSRVAESRAT
jgi:phosphosulfolactate phosphohydrolase-like enzyme